MSSSVTGRMSSGSMTLSNAVRIASRSGCTERRRHHAPVAAGAKQAGLPASTKRPTCDVAGKEIKTGDDARCFAQYMRIHALEASGGLTYAQLGRYVAAADPTNPKGTRDAAAATKDEKGQ